MDEWKIKGRRPKYPNEAWVKKQVKDQLEALKERYEDIWWYMPNGGYYGVSGIPDFIICFFGRFVSIETKDTDGKWSQAQQDKQKDISNAGGCYFLVDEDGIFTLWKYLSITDLNGGFFDLRGADDKAT